MFPAGAVDEAEPMAGYCSVAPAGTDQLDLEAAEQLIQLSGGDGAAADDNADAGSESRSADSVKCHRKEKEKEKEAAAVESRRSSGAAGRIPEAATKEMDGNGGSASDIKGAVDSSFACSATAADDDVVAKDKAVVVAESRRRGERFPAGKDHDGGILHGEARKRPRFRPLAAIYRDTEPGRLAAGAGEGHAGRDPPEAETKKKKRSADGVIAVDAEAKASKARPSVQLAHTRI